MLLIQEKHLYKFMEELISIKNLSVVCNNYGNLLSQLGRFDDANDKYTKGIEIRPDYAIAYSNLLFNLNFKNNLDQKLYLSWAKKFRENCKNLKNLNLNYNYDKNPKKHDIRNKFYKFNIKATNA